MAERSYRLPWITATPAAPGAALPDVRNIAQSSPPEGRSDLHWPHLEALYRIRRPELIRYLMRLGIDWVEAEDLAQEAFLRAFAAPDRKHPDNLFNWALTCAKNLAIDRFRHRRKESLAPATLWKEWEETLIDHAAVNAEICMSEVDEQRQLAQAIAQLGAVEQQCLVLRSRGLSFREMASTLGIPMQSAVYTTDVAIRKVQRKLKRASE
ncbi:MAG: RNA polymerase sigma factor [Acidobacteriota bacterium]|nr:RNA polymerase sigma factor [Acidobacteriota bacterium]